MGGIKEVFGRIADLFRPRAKLMIKSSDVIVQMEKTVYLDYSLQKGFERKTFYQAEEVKGHLILTSGRLMFISDQQQDYFNVPAEAVKSFTIVSKKEIELHIKENGEEKKHSLRVSSPQKWKNNIAGIIQSKIGRYPSWLT